MVARLCFLGILASLPSAAVTLAQWEDFSSPTFWTSGAPNPNPPVVVADAGPLGAGDSALRITGNGGGPGGRLVALESTLWTGDYAAAGVSGISIDLRNAGTNGLSVRLAFNGPGGWFVTPAAPLPAFGGWTARHFETTSGSLVSAGGDDVTATLGGVTEMRLLHSPAPDFRGPSVSGVLLADNLRAIPEPGLSTLLAASLGGIVFRRRRPAADDPRPACEVRDFPIG